MLRSASTRTRTFDGFHSIPMALTCRSRQPVTLFFLLCIGIARVRACSVGDNVQATDPSDGSPKSAAIASINASTSQITVSWTSGAGQSTLAAASVYSNGLPCGTSAPTSSPTSAPASSPQTCPSGAKINVYAAAAGNCSSSPVVAFTLVAGSNLTGRGKTVRACASWTTGSAQCIVGDSVQAFYAGDNSISGARILGMHGNGTIDLGWDSGASLHTNVKANQVVKAGRTCAQASQTKVEEGLLSGECHEHGHLLLRWCTPSKGPCDIVASTYRVQRENMTGPRAFATGACESGAMPSGAAFLQMVSGSNLNFGACTEPEQEEATEVVTEAPPDTTWETFGQILLFVASGLFLVIICALQVVHMTKKF